MRCATSSPASASVASPPRAATRDSSRAAAAAELKRPRRAPKLPVGGCYNVGFVRARNPMSPSTRASLLSLCLLLMCACATLPPGSKRDPRDPWERMNRATYKFNDKFDRGIAQPVARGYRKVTPHFVQTGVRNFMDNLNYPVVMI